MGTLQGYPRDTEDMEWRSPMDTGGAWGHWGPQETPGDIRQGGRITAQSPLSTLLHL